MQRLIPSLRTAFVACTVACALTSAALAEPGPAPQDPIDGSGYPGMMWHVETLDGEVVSSRKGDRTLNPASVVKVATTLWALERLGPGQRFETRIMTAGAAAPVDGVLQGDLVVVGYGDPDFHKENAFTVARKLNELGIHTVEGKLLIHAPFWIGWEGGSEKRVADADQRNRVMAARFRSAVDPHRWDRSTQRTWRKYADRNGLDVRDDRPRVEVLGGYGVVDAPPSGARTVVVHRSKTLADVLRRFNAYSNNDIERLDNVLGGAPRIAAALRERWGPAGAGIEFETMSGLGVNRMTPRQVVRLLRDLVSTTRDLGMDPAAVLPVAGCDPGTLRNFPRLSADGFAGALLGKTGTLIYTDRGVSILAGIASTASGDVLFCVAMPKAGRKLHWARRLEEDFVLELFDLSGGPQPRACSGPLPWPEDGATVFRQRGGSATLLGGP